jgi:phospholipase C
MKFLARMFIVLAVVIGLAGTASAATLNQQRATQTSTPITHLVVIFQENVSFDHYFGTYPYALNPAGEPVFKAKTNTPSVNGLTQDLLTNNPNLANPRRLDRSQALTCDLNHDYTPEQQAFDHGLMDKFVQFTSSSSCTDKNIVMDYYDGNTVTAVWNHVRPLDSRSTQSGLWSDLWSYSSHPHRCGLQRHGDWRC